MGRASRAKRERHEAEAARTWRWYEHASRVAVVTLVTVTVLAAAVTAVAWWADARAGSDGVYLGFVLGTRSARASGVTVPDGALAIVALGLSVVPVVLAVLGLVSTWRSPTRRPSWLTGAGGVAGLVIGPAVAGTCVATVLLGADSGWAQAMLVWPYLAVVPGCLAADEVASRIRRPAPTRR